MCFNTNQMTVLTHLAKRQDKAKSMYVVPTIDGYKRAYGSVLHTRTTPARPLFLQIKYDN